MKFLVKALISRHFSTILISLLIISTFIITGHMIISIKQNLDEYKVIKPSEKTEIVTEDMIEVIANDQYIVKEYDGRIGVFIPGDSLPITIIQEYVVYLPEKDRDSLREGITVNGKKSLDKLLEDLTS